MCHYEIPCVVIAYRASTEIEFCINGLAQILKATIVIDVFNS